MRFLDYFLPLPASDDVYKVVLLKLEGTLLKKSFTIVFLDKVFGLICLSVILPFSIYKLTNLNGIPLTQIYFLSFSLIGLSISCLYIIYNPKFLSMALNFLGKKITILSKIENAKYELNYDKHYFLIHVIFVVLNNLLQPLCIFIIFYSLGVIVNFLMLIAILPLMMLVRVLPISYQGFGLYEGALVVLLSLTTTIPESIILNVSIIHLSLSTLVNFAGGGFLIGNSIKSDLLNAINIKY